MEINHQRHEDATILALSGRLDTVTSNQLAQSLEQVFGQDKTNLVLDLSDLDYISSAGLRVLLTAQKKVNSLGTRLEITGANATVKEVFDITGFSSILTIL